MPTPEQVCHPIAADSATPKRRFDDKPVYRPRRNLVLSLFGFYALLACCWWLA